VSKATYIICLLVLVFASFISAATSIEIDSRNNFIDGEQTFFAQLAPGDTVFLLAGDWDYLLVRNIAGSKEKPIVFINKGGIVSIDTDHYFGIAFQHCRNFKITGTGIKSEFYGIQIKRVGNGTGLSVGNLSSDFEIEHISIKNVPIAAIYAKTDPDCSGMTTRDKFTQYNTVIHDNYIENAGNEGMYVGSTKYFGQTVSCNGKDTVLLPSLLDGVKVYNNVIKNSGWDGIQVSSASKDCQVFGNTIIGDSQSEVPAQMSGIIIGGGSTCDCYNNYIVDGKGDGVEIHGLGGNKIFNNIIINPGITYYPGDFEGPKMKYGIYVTDVSVESGSSFFILNNTIVNPKSDGIRFFSVESRNNVASNLIINPGNYDHYENDNTRYEGIDSYVAIPDLDAEVTLLNNYFTREFSDAGINDNYFPLAGSPLIDAGYTGLPSINFDFDNQPRPVGSAPDIGAYEYQTALGFEDIKPQLSSFWIYPNPATDRVTISIPAAQIAAGTIISIYNSGLQIRSCIRNERGI